MNQDQLRSIEYKLWIIVAGVFFLLGISVANSVSIHTKPDICDLDRSGDLNLRDLSILAEEIRNQK